MSDRPIIFSAPMVCALLEGRKTMTRRLVSPSTCTVNGCRYSAKSAVWRGLKFDHQQVVRRPAMLTVPFQHPDDARDWPWEDEPISYRVRPIIEPGDRLWVRETWENSTGGPKDVSCRATIHDDARGSLTDEEIAQMRWRSPIHMPRWASRLTLVVTATKIERLQDISADDAKAEGLKALTKDGTLVKYGIPDRDGWPGNDDHGWHWHEWEVDPRMAFKRLWNSIHGAGAWDANPYVVALTFENHNVNIDQMKAA